MATIQVGNQTLGYRRLGAGDPIVVINGFSATKDDWDPQFIESLANHFDLILVDNRGMGESTGPATDFTVPDLVGDVIGVMNALDIESAEVLGWSMGGFVAMSLAHQHPARVRKVVLLATTAGGDAFVASSAEVHDRLRDLSGDPHEQASRLISLLFTPERAEVIEREFGDLVAGARADLDLEVVRRQIEVLDQWEQIGFGHLSDISAPTLVAAGIEDVVFPTRNALNIASAIPGAWLAQFENSAHAFMADHPQSLGRLVATFVEAD